MKQFFKSPWTISLTATLFGFILTIAYDLLKGKQVLSTIKAFFLISINGISVFLNFELKVWWVLLVIIIVIAILLCIGYITRRKSSACDNPEFTKYTEDYFGSWKWSWTWSFDSFEEKWFVQDLKAHCPKCDTPMLHDEYESYYSCPRCGFQPQYLDRHKKMFEVEAIIHDNVSRSLKEKKNET